MSVHTLLEGQIKVLGSIGDLETKRKRLEQLPALTKALERTHQQALYLSFSIELIQQMFVQEPACKPNDYQPHLQKPLGTLSSPNEVFIKSQGDLTEFQTQLEDTYQALKALSDKTDKQITNFKRGLYQEIDTVRGLLRVPELLPENTKAAQVEKILNEMDTLIKDAQTTLNLLTQLKVNSTKNLEQLADKWTPLYATFTAIRQQLSFERLRKPPYEFDEKTIAVIKELVSGKTLTLDKLMPITVYELHQKNFKQFLSQIVLRFTAQN